jgi:hypothetical protein
MSRLPAPARRGGWHSCPVTETPSAHGSLEDTGTTSQPGTAEPPLDALVGEWLDWAACGAALGVSVSRVRQLIKEHQLAAAVPRPGAGQQVPAALIMDGSVVKGIPGLLTLLHDGKYDDREIIAWLFSEDDSLPGRPIDALRENRGSEVKRRAQAMAL